VPRGFAVLFLSNWYSYLFWLLVGKSGQNSRAVCGLQFRINRADSHPYIHTHTYSYSQFLTIKDTHPDGFKLLNYISTVVIHYQAFLLSSNQN
jgi:hypothetical protein